MPNVDDHGLEVLKKAAVDIGDTPKRDYALQTVLANKFAIPANADAYTREVVGNSVIFKFRQGGIAGTILKTITLYYSSPQDPDHIGGALT